MVRVPCDVGAPISFSCPRAGVCYCSHVTNAVSSSLCSMWPWQKVRDIWGESSCSPGRVPMTCPWVPLGGTAGPCTFGAHWGCGRVRILHRVCLWGCVLPVLALGRCGVLLAAHSSALCSLPCWLSSFWRMGTCPCSPAGPAAPGCPAAPAAGLYLAARGARSPSPARYRMGKPQALSQGTPQALLLALTTFPLCSAVQSLPEPADGDAGQHHAALRPLHQTQR